MARHCWEFFNDFLSRFLLWEFPSYPGLNQRSVINKHSWQRKVAPSVALLSCYSSSSINRSCITAANGVVMSFRPEDQRNVPPTSGQASSSPQIVPVIIPSIFHGLTVTAKCPTLIRWTGVNSNFVPVTSPWSISTRMLQTFWNSQSHILPSQSIQQI